MRSYDRPVSDHFDGRQFFDPDGVAPKSLREVLRWQFGRDRQRQSWPEWVPSPHSDTPPTRVAGDRVRLSFVGHVSWLIQTSGLNVLIDPVWWMFLSWLPDFFHRLYGTGLPPMYFADHASLTSGIRRSSSARTTRPRRIAPRSSSYDGPSSTTAETRRFDSKFRTAITIILTSPRFQDSRRNSRRG